MKLHYIAFPDYAFGKGFGKVDALAGLIVLFALYHVSTAIYRLYFHPLRHIPGPWYAAMSRVFYMRNHINGGVAGWLRCLHDQYGEVVRYSPNEISFISGETAWQDIYGFRTGRSKGVGSFEKDPVWYPPGLENVRSILSAPGENHGRQRRAISHAFSVQALKAQEGLIQGYTDLLIHRLKEATSSSSCPVEMCQWYNWTTFDIIADLLFGEPFGCLADLATHKYVHMIINSIRGFRFFYVMEYWPWTKYLGSLILDKDAIRKRRGYMQWVREQTHQRINTETERPDFMKLILDHRKDDGENSNISDPEIVASANALLVAGTETTATTLSAVTWLLLQNPKCLRKVVHEVRSHFNTSKDITIDAVTNELPYMRACLTETLRCIPPVPAGFIRKVPKGGAIVSGHHIPGGCNASVSMSQDAAYHSSRNFRDADRFVPERWLDDPRYGNDNKTVLQPFSFGPRNCIGKNLAHAEMRLTLAKMVLNFDFELDRKSERWDQDMNVFTLWEKRELWVRLKTVQSSVA